MNLKKTFRSSVAAGILGLLLVSGGCMMAPHQGAYAASGYNDDSSPPSYEIPSDAAPGSEMEPMERNSPGRQHGMMNPDSRWAWLAGGGMILMMVLMAL